MVGVTCPTVMVVGREVGVGCGAGFTEQAEGGRLHVGTNGQSNDTCRTGAFLREGVFVRSAAVFELGFRGRSARKRGHHGEDEHEREEDCATHGGHRGRLVFIRIAFE